VWKILLRKLVILMVFMWCFRTRGGETVWSTVGRSLENRLHSVKRWRAVCTPFSGHLQIGGGVLFILWRYERKLLWFVRDWVGMKFGQRERESLWKMVGMNSLVWEAFTESVSLSVGYSGRPISWPHASVCYRCYRINEVLLAIPLIPSCFVWGQIYHCLLRAFIHLFI
jgi:hypothetical protein